jgi:hypothetical protein
MNHDRSDGSAAIQLKTGRIIVRGEFGPLLAAALPECKIATGYGETLISAEVRDDSELFGTARRLRDFGATLISVSVEQVIEPSGGAEDIHEHGALKPANSRG